MKEINQIKSHLAELGRQFREIGVTKGEQAKHLDVSYPTLRTIYKVKPYNEAYIRKLETYLAERKSELAAKYPVTK